MKWSKKEMSNPNELPEFSNGPPTQTNPLEEYVISMDAPASAGDPAAAERIAKLFQAAQDSQSWVKKRVKTVNERAGAMLADDVIRFVGQKNFELYLRTAQETINFTRDLAGDNQKLNLNATTFGVAFAFWVGYLSRCREESQGTLAFVPEAGYVDPFQDGTVAREDDESDAEQVRIRNAFAGVSDEVAAYIDARMAANNADEGE